MSFAPHVLSIMCAASAASREVEEAGARSARVDACARRRGLARSAGTRRDDGRSRRRNACKANRGTCSTDTASPGVAYGRRGVEGEWGWERGRNPVTAACKWGTKCTENSAEFRPSDFEIGREQQWTRGCRCCCASRRRPPSRPSAPRSGIPTCCCSSTSRTACAHGQPIQPQHAREEAPGGGASGGH